MDEQRARQRLNETLAALDETAGRVRQDNDEFREQPEYESGRLSQHPADYGTDVENRNEQALFLGEAQQERERVFEAFARLDEGTFGTCRNCGRPIGEERLEARPHAALCVDCEEKFERQTAPR